MKLGVSAWSVQAKLFEKKTNLVEFIDFCRSHGVEAVELLDCFFESKEHIAQTKDYLDKIKMPVAAYSIGNDFVQDEHGVREQIQYVKNGVDTAVFLGTKNLRVFSGSENENISFEKGIKIIIQSLKECAQYAETRGITLVLENHGLFAGKSSSIIEIIKSVNSPALRANTDTGNFLLVGEDPAEAVRHLKEYVSLVHFKDMTQDDKNGHYTALNGLKYSGTVIGEGDVNMEDIVATLKEHGYDGYLSIEFEGSGDPYKGTEKSIINTQRVLQKYK